MGAGNRNVQADVDELRRSAMSARAQMMVEQTTTQRDIATRRDTLVARQRSAERSARDTEVEAAKADMRSQELEALDTSLVLASKTAKASGNTAQGEELWERHLQVSTDLEVSRGRAARLFDEAKQQTAAAEALAEPILEVDREATKFKANLDAAEAEVDKLDEKARLLERAQEKLTEAASTSNPEAQRQAQALLEQAEAIEVDEAKIEAVTDSWETPELGGGPTTPMALPDDEPRVPPVTPTPKPAEPDSPLPDPSDRDSVDVAAEQRELASDIGALRDEASSTRAAMLARVEDRAKELGLLRDQTAREQWAAEQASKAAQMQVQRETREVNEAKATAERLNRDADAAASRGDRARAESLREDADAAAMEQRVREARLASAETEVSQQGTLAASLKQDIRALEVTYDEVLQSRRTAESALDNLEEKALLLEQAKQKFAEAEHKDSARALREAQELVNRAEKLNVDRDAVRQILPDFPAETPGLDDTNLVFDVPAGLDGRVAALTADAVAAREQLVDAVATRNLDDLREADRLRLEKASADEAAETVELRRNVVDDAKARLAEQEQEAQAAEAAGDPARATEIREAAQINAKILEQREQLLAEAEQAEAALRPRAEEIQRRLDEINARKDADERASDAAEAELDKLEQQTALLDQARQRFTEASQTRDPATLRSAQALFVQAEAITVDRAIVRAYLPDFPAAPPAAPEPDVDTPTTPAADAHSGEIQEPTLVAGASVSGDDGDALGESDVVGDEALPDAGAVEDSGAGAPETAEPSEFEEAIAAADSLSDQFASWFESDSAAAAPADTFAAADTFADSSFDSSLGGQPDDFAADASIAMLDDPAPSGEPFDA